MEWKEKKGEKERKESREGAEMGWKEKKGEKES